MKTIVSILTILLCMASPSYAQLIAKDSTGVMAISLDEVTIQARSIIEKGDRKVILPTQNQLKISSSGIDLLGKLQLPRITVDIMSGEITTSGNGEVQLRINGVRVTYTEISSLSPEDILRIEYHDTPGARYGNAAAVIDYITKNKKAGGSVSGGAIHSLSSNRTSIDDMISGRYNYGKSEISANVRYIQRKGDWTREYDERFIFPDNELHRLETGEPTLFNKKLLASNLLCKKKENISLMHNSDIPCKIILPDMKTGRANSTHLIPTSRYPSTTIPRNETICHPSIYTISRI